MAELDNSGEGSPSAEERKRQSKLMARTKNVSKQAVVGDEDAVEDEGGAYVAASVQTTGSLAKTWSPGFAAAVAKHALLEPAEASRQLDGDDLRDLNEEKAASRLRAERIAKRTAKLRELEVGEVGEDELKGVGSKFGESDEKVGKMSKLDHQAVFGNRNSVADGLLDLSTAPQRKRASVSQSGLDLDDGSMRRGGQMQSPRNQKLKRASKQAEERRMDSYLATKVEACRLEESRHDAEPDTTAANSPVQVPEVEGAGADDDKEEDEESLGPLLQEMAKNLSNKNLSSAERQDLQRELLALKKALAEGDDVDDNDHDGGGRSKQANVAGTHRESIGKTSIASSPKKPWHPPDRALNGARASPKRNIVRDDISSSDDSAEEGPRVPAPALRRPHVYEAKGLRDAAAAANAAAKAGKVGLMPSKREKGARGIGSDDEGDMRPMSPLRSPASEDSDDASRDPCRFAGSKTLPPERGSRDPPSFSGAKTLSPERERGNAGDVRGSKVSGGVDTDAGSMGARMQEERQKKLGRMPLSKVHASVIESHTDAAALQVRF